jgi:hypothetical protein
MIAHTIRDIPRHRLEPGGGPRFGAGGLFEIGPPTLSLFNYHSTRRSTLRAVRWLKVSAFSPTEAMTWSIWSATRSGA